MNLGRKIKRRKQKAQKKDAERDLAAALTMFDELGEECSACREPFDRTDKEMAQTWNVVVRRQEKIVRLYCPECWSTAQSVVATVMEGGEDGIKT